MNEEEKKDDFVVLNGTGEDNAVKARELPTGLDESLLQTITQVKKEQLLASIASE